MSAFQDAKLWIIEHVYLARDALHIYVALGIFFASAVLFGWKIGGARPWLLVLCAALAGEAWDIRDHAISDMKQNYPGNLHDIWNTLFWPSAITLLARYSAVFGSRADEVEQPLEQPPAVAAAMRGLDPALGMRHHAEDVAAGVEQPGDVAR